MYVLEIYLDHQEPLSSETLKHAVSISIVIYNSSIDVQCRKFCNLFQLAMRV